MAAPRRQREALELRPLTIKFGALPHDQHDGSALVSMGPVKALAAMSGPSEVRIRDEKTDTAALEVHYTPLQGIAGGTASTAFSHAVEGIAQSVLLLHLYPRSLVSLHLTTYAAPAACVSRPLRSRHQAVPVSPPPTQPPHPDAPLSVALQAAHINAATCACLDAAAVGMRAMVTSVSAAVLRKGVRANLMRGWRAGETVQPQQEIGASRRDIDADDSDDDDEGAFEVVLDPTPYEESLARSTHVAAFAFTRRRKLASRTAQDTDAEAMDTSGDAEDDESVRSTLQGTLVYSSSQGSYSTEDLLEVTTVCRAACKDVALQMRKGFASQRLGATSA